MTNALKLTETDSDFLEKFGCKITDGDKEYYFSPFYYEKISNGLFIERKYNDLPKSVVDFLKLGTNETT